MHFFAAMNAVMANFHSVSGVCLTNFIGLIKTLEVIGSFVCFHIIDSFDLGLFAIAIPAITIAAFITSAFILFFPTINAAKNIVLIFLPI